jgi:ketosteroid isomerase-like protein
MKKLILLTLTIVLFSACDKQEKRYTQQSSEIETVKKLIENYNNKDYDVSIYADSSKTHYNSKDKSMSPEQTIAYHKANDAIYSSRNFVVDDPEYEMVVTDKGDTWVNCWLDWKGTMAGNNKEINIPIHLTYQFLDGKIVREVGYWDSTEIALELQGINAANNTPKNNSNIVNIMYAAFAKGDIPSVLEKLDDNVIWNEAEGNSYADGNPYVGPDAVLNGIFKRIGDDYEYFHLDGIELHEMANNQILANMRYKAKLKKNGAIIDAQAAHLWTLKDGKAIGFQQYVDTKQLDEALNK